MCKTLVVPALLMIPCAALSAWNDEKKLTPSEEPGARKLLATFIAKSADFPVTGLRQPMDCSDTRLLGIVTGKVAGLPRPSWWQEGMSESDSVLVYANGSVHLGGGGNETTRARVGDAVHMCCFTSPRSATAPRADV